MLGPTKVIHGSDSPEPSFLLELNKIEMALSDKKDRELVLGSNMSRILGIR
jgi:predicted TIM-barrel fold metal-dependent hydrolase